MMPIMSRRFSLFNVMHWLRRGTVDGGLCGSDDPERVVQLRSAGPCPDCGEERIVEAVRVADSLVFSVGRLERVSCVCGTRLWRPGGRGG